MSGPEIRFIGTGNAFAAGGACWNGFVLDGRYLFEAPPQALMSLQRPGFDIAGIEAVILSHHHGDHYLGMAMLMLQWKYWAPRKRVTVVGPPGTERICRQLAAIAYPGLGDAVLPIDWVEIGPGQGARVGDLQLEAVEMQHDTDLDVCLGFHVRLGNHAFAYTGDTAMCEGVERLAAQTPLLIAECALMGPIERPIHISVQDLPALRKLLPAESRLVLTHLAAGVRGLRRKGVTVARDGMRLEL